MKKTLSLGGDWQFSNGSFLAIEANKQWVCLSTRVRSEATVAAYCHNLSIRFFLPMLRQRRSNRLVSLFPGYIFSNVTADDVRSLKGLSLIRAIHQIPEQSELIEYLTSLSVVSELSDHLLHPGDRVRLSEGPLNGIEGVVVKTLDSKSMKVHVTVNGFGPGAVIQVSPTALELVNSDRHSVERVIRIRVAEINKALIRHLARHPNTLYRLDPRRFEVLIAELLADMGYEVFITPEQKDHGRDILAVLKLPIGKTLTVVECKRYGPNNKIEVDLVERLLWVADQHDRASSAMLATTATFTSGARAIEREYRWKLKLADHNDIVDWLGKYGTWKSDRVTGLWLPSNELYVPQGSAEEK